MSAPLPELSDVDGILSLGGQQSVLDIDREPGLGVEAALLRAAVEDGVELPPGAVELLRGAGHGAEALRVGPSAWGVQFHAKVDALRRDDRARSASRGER